MSLYAVRYEYASGSGRRRDAHRPAHVEYLGALFARGILVASGRLEDESRPGALIIVRAESAREVEHELDGDPFRSAGVIAERDVREWAVAFGTTALER